MQPWTRHSAGCRCAERWGPSQYGGCGQGRWCPWQVAASCRARSPTWVHTPQPSSSAASPSSVRPGVSSLPWRPQMCPAAVKSRLLLCGACNGMTPSKRSNIRSYSLHAGCRHRISNPCSARLWLCHGKPCLIVGTSQSAGHTGLACRLAIRPDTICASPAAGRISRRCSLWSSTSWHRKLQRC